METLIITATDYARASTLLASYEHAPALVTFGARCLAQGRADGQRIALSERGREGGRRGGNARAAALTPERRKEIASKAAKARWGESRDNSHARRASIEAAEHAAITGKR